MKDYSKSLEERREFILSYKIKDEQIIIKLANGKSYPIPYTEENEKMVIARVEHQARNANVEPINGLVKFYAISFPLFFLPLSVYNYINRANWFRGMLIVLNLFYSVYDPIKWISNILKKRDVQKSSYFLDNAETINKHLSNPNSQIGLNKKTIAKIEEVKASGKPFNINDVDKLSLSELRQLKANIDRIMSFGFDEGTATVGQGHQKTYGIKEEYK